MTAQHLYVSIADGLKNNVVAIGQDKHETLISLLPAGKITDSVSRLAALLIETLPAGDDYLVVTGMEGFHQFAFPANISVSKPYDIYTQLQFESAARKASAESAKDSRPKPTMTARRIVRPVLKGTVEAATPAKAPAVNKRAPKVQAQQAEKNVYVHLSKSLLGYVMAYQFEGGDIVCQPLNYTAPKKFREELYEWFAGLPEATSTVVMYATLKDAIDPFEGLVFKEPYNAHTTKRISAVAEAATFFRKHVNRMENRAQEEHYRASQQAADKNVTPPSPRTEVRARNRAAMMRVYFDTGIAPASTEVASESISEVEVPTTHTPVKKVQKTYKTLDVYTDASVAAVGKGVGISGWVRRTRKANRKPEYGIQRYDGLNINHLETNAIVEAIINNTDTEVLNIHSDSKNAIRTVQTLIESSELPKGYRSALEPYRVKIQALMDQEELKINFTWVKGHSDNTWNNIVDQMVGHARQHAKRHKIEKVRVLTGEMMDKMFETKFAK